MSANYTFVSHILYLVASLALTIWVARSLHRHGRPFLIDSFAGNESLADSVNHLLVVGFYLANIGYASLALRFGRKPTTSVEALEFLSTKIGLVLGVLGAMHFLNTRSAGCVAARCCTVHRHRWSRTSSSPRVPHERVRP
jgi:hypothetical protein